MVLVLYCHSDDVAEVRWQMLLLSSVLQVNRQQCIHKQTTV